MRRGGKGSLVVLLLAAACGGAGGPRLEAPARPDAIDPPRFLLEYAGRRANALSPPERSIDALEEARREARGDERRQAVRELAIAHLLAAEQAPERDATRHRRSALRFARAASRGTDDDWLAAEMAFIEVWSAWRAGRGGAANVAERFARRHPRSGDLVYLCWIIRGEVAFEREDWDEAAEAYRFVLGSIEHPLYGYALYRTAHAWKGLGRDDDTEQALREVVQLGCAADAADEAREMAALAQSDLRMPDVTLEDGTSRPEICSR